MKFKIGQKVRIKPFAKIKKTLDAMNETGSIYFNGEMEEFCGRVVTLKELSCKHGFSCHEIPWCWHSEWLEPLEESYARKEKAILIRGVSENEVRRCLGHKAKSIEVVEVNRTIKDVLKEIDDRTFDVTFVFHQHYNTTIGCDVRGNYVGIARKHPNDKRDLSIARGLCKARAMKMKALEKELLSLL